MELSHRVWSTRDRFVNQLWRAFRATSPPRDTDQMRKSVGMYEYTKQSRTYRYALPLSYKCVLLRYCSKGTTGVAHPTISNSVLPTPCTQRSWKGQKMTYVRGAPVKSSTVLSHSIQAFERVNGLIRCADEAKPCRSSSYTHNDALHTKPTVVPERKYSIVNESFYILSFGCLELSSRVETALNLSLYTKSIVTDVRLSGKSPHLSSYMHAH